MCSLPASCRNTNTIVFYVFSANATPPSESQTTKWSQWQQALSTIYMRNENREDSPKIHYGPIKLRQTCIYCALLLLLLCLCALTSVWHTQCKHTKITTEKDNFGACLRNCSFHKAWHVFFLVFYNTMLDATLEFSHPSLCLHRENTHSQMNEHSTKYYAIYSHIQNHFHGIL